MFAAKMSCRCSKRLNRQSPSPVPASHGHGCRRGRGGGCVAARAALNLEEEVPPAREQHVEEPIPEEAGTTQPRGEDTPHRGNDAPPPPPLLSEVMDGQTCLMETLAEGLLRCNGGPRNDF